MTIDERVESLQINIKNTESALTTKFLKAALLDVARDQREVAAREIRKLPPAARQHVEGCIFRDSAYRAILAAEIK